MKIKIKRLKMRKLRDMLGDEGGCAITLPINIFDIPGWLSLIPELGSCAVDLATCIPEMTGLITVFTDCFGALADCVDMVGFVFGK
ncbi:MAG: hypothetical protein MASP_00923 [Candidatus Methanolliviera sp. GoM_asphalt]|nr:MAG: hypothetical protein MASP_00923 [Candidatus Methanolliviera sp. GoM_asphalt]